jgi:hypothetical protein
MAPEPASDSSTISRINLKTGPFDTPPAGKSNRGSVVAQLDDEGLDAVLAEQRKRSIYDNVA